MKTLTERPPLSQPFLQPTRASLADCCEKPLLVLIVEIRLRLPHFAQQRALQPTQEEKDKAAQIQRQNLEVGGTGITTRTSTSSGPLCEREIKKEEQRTERRRTRDTSGPADASTLPPFGDREATHRYKMFANLLLCVYSGSDCLKLRAVVLPPRLAQVC